jgi:hypothetical protein
MKKIQFLLMVMAIAMFSCNDEMIRVNGGGGDDDDDPIFIPPPPDPEGGNSVAPPDTLNI